MAAQEADPSLLTKGLIGLLDVSPASREGHFIGQRKPGGVGRVFGGQVVGQAIMAATKTVAQDRSIHSLHAYFIRPGSEDHVIDFAVEADMDGRSFSNRRVVASQQGKPIFNMIASFHRRETSPHHQAAMPDVPGPDGLTSLATLFSASPLAAGPALRRMLTRPSPIEFRPTDPAGVSTLGEAREPRASVWLRVGTGPLGVSQAMQRAVLGTVSDYLLLATAYRPHGLEIGGVQVQGASIDHSIWFHDDVECGDWILYDLESPWSGQARGIGFGRFFARDGRLVASVAQEGLMRLVSKEG